MAVSKDLNGRLYSIVDELVRQGLSLDQARREFERQFIVSTLKSNSGNHSRPPNGWGCTAIPCATSSRAWGSTRRSTMLASAARGEITHRLPVPDGPDCQRPTTLNDQPLWVSSDPSESLPSSPVRPFLKFLIPSPRPFPRAGILDAPKSTRMMARMTSNSVGLGIDFLAVGRGR